MENGKLFVLIVFVVFCFILAILLIFMQGDNQTQPPNNFPTLKEVCERCTLVKGLPYQDRFESPLTRFMDDDYRDVPSCIHTYSVPEDSTDVSQPLSSACCLASVDPILVCPEVCFDMKLQLDDGMAGSIARMRSNDNCWNSDTVPDRGYMTET